MDLLIAPNTVPLADADTAPATGTPGYATDGDPSKGTARTPFPAYAWNAVQIELTTVITKAGLTLNRGNNTLLYQAIQLISEAGANNNCIGKASGPQDYSPLQGGVNRSSGNIWFSYKDDSGTVKYTFAQQQGDYATNTSLKNEITRATTIEGNLQTQKVDKANGAMSALSVSIGTGSFNMSNPDAPGYATWMRGSSVASDGILDLYSNVGSVGNNVLRLCADGSVRIIGEAGGWFYVQEKKVALETDIADLQSQVDGKQASGDYATNTALNNGLSGKLDVTTYQGDFNTSNDSVINLPYNNRIECFVISGINSGSNYAAFPEGFSEIPKVIPGICSNSYSDIWVYDVTKDGFYYNTNSSGPQGVSATFIAVGKKS